MTQNEIKELNAEIKRLQKKLYEATKEKKESEKVYFEDFCLEKANNYTWERDSESYAIKIIYSKKDDDKRWKRILVGESKEDCIRKGWEFIDRMKGFLASISESERSNQMISKQKMAYTPVICVTSGDGYEEGKIYPMMGWNNGVHILRTNDTGDVVDREFCTGGYGKGLYNSFSNEGKPSFDETVEQEKLHG